MAGKIFQLQFRWKAFEELHAFLVCFLSDEKAKSGARKDFQCHLVKAIHVIQHLFQSEVPSVVKFLRSKSGVAVVNPCVKPTMGYVRNKLFQLTNLENSPTNLKVRSNTDTKATTCILSCKSHLFPTKILGTVDGLREYCSHSSIHAGNSWNEDNWENGIECNFSLKPNRQHSARKETETNTRSRLMQNATYTERIFQSY